jgi:hypothetical protein
MQMFALLLELSVALVYFGVRKYKGFLEQLDGDFIVNIQFGCKEHIQV